MGRARFGSIRIWVEQCLGRIGFGLSRIWVEQDLGRARFGSSRIWVKQDLGRVGSGQVYRQRVRIWFLDISYNGKIPDFGGVEIMYDFSFSINKTLTPLAREKLFWALVFLS